MAEEQINEIQSLFYSGMTKADIAQKMGCRLKEVVYCKFCKYNYGLAHGGEFNNNDIVCDYFNTDGLHEDDFCSRGIKA